MGNKKLIRNKHIETSEILSIGVLKSDFFPLLTKFTEGIYTYYYLLDKILVWRSKNW